MGRAHFEEFLSGDSVGEKTGQETRDLVVKMEKEMHLWFATYRFCGTTDKYFLIGYSYISHGVFLLIGISIFGVDTNAWRMFATFKNCLSYQGMYA
ncbi:hypothetical protein H6P81_001460 [Aristolochia fimbriata]|uniref:Uncharacterized protein n=1 Tax=Aristolochia fimbriata TaxID=158543 RepID=A0AAV7F725_ARIFI|nr:hypothetical protein H6P81_001460 [Aristolochia fimbriata]